MANFSAAIRFALAIMLAGIGVTSFLQPVRVAAQVAADPIADTWAKMQQFYSQGRFRDALPLAEQLVELNRARFGGQSSQLAIALYELGNILTGLSRFGDAESHLRQALALFGTDPRHATRKLQTEAMLANALVQQSKLDEGLPLMHRSAIAMEAALGGKDPRAIAALYLLAQTLHVSGRAAEAEPIFRRLIETVDPADLQTLAPLHGSRAAALSQLGRPDEALTDMRRSLEILRQISKDHAFLGQAINNLGFLEQSAGNLAAAEALYRESLDHIERTTGRESESYATGLMNLAVVQRDQGRIKEAELSTRRVLAIFEKSLGTSHPKTGSAANSLAVLLSARGAWAEALALFEQATQSAVRHARSLGSEDGRVANSVYGLNPGDFPAHLRAIHRVAPDDPQRREQAFALLQRSLNSRTAKAITRMAARAAITDSALAKLVREQQDLRRLRTVADEALVLALGAGSEKIQSARVEVDRIDGALARLDARLKAEFPHYDALDSTEPVALADIQRSLTPREAMVAFVEVEGNASIPAEVHAWVVTAQTTLWRRLDLAKREPGWRVPTLRCGLDAVAWSRAPEICSRLTGVAWTADTGKPLPYNVARAHEVYKELFGPLEGALRLPDGDWRDLIVIASGPLSVIPFGALVTEPPPQAFSVNYEGYRSVKWLGLRQPITVLPAIASLEALRRVAKPSAATKPMIGFGNPLLDGNQSDLRFGDHDKMQAKLASERQRCPASRWRQLASVVGWRGSLEPVATDGLANIAKLKALSPLPETADELCAVALDLNVAADEIRLGARATERDVKALSASGDLAQYRILHFATHGALAGETSGSSEPGLVLTPPTVATSTDDGYLSVSEIAALKIDADWVVLSACNTAGPEGGRATGGKGIEALSGIARAFFFAGARALLVSHWYVDSQATVALITGAFAELKADRRLGRAEAMRRSMLRLIASGDERMAHPANWAPFVVVGEGAALR